MKKAELASLITVLGTSVNLEMIASGAKPALKVLTQSVGKLTEALINSYGVNGREFVFGVDDLPYPPEKFDVVTLDGERFVIDVPQTLREDGSGLIIGWRAYAKGK